MTTSNSFYITYLCNVISLSIYLTMIIGEEEIKLVEVSLNYDGIGAAYL